MQKSLDFWDRDLKTHKRKVGKSLPYFTVMYLDFVIELLPAAFFTVKLTVYFPALLYLCTGFLAVDVLLSPKLQDQEVGDPVLLSVNVTVSGAFSEIGGA